jgi:ribonuclease P protein component
MVLIPLTGAARFESAMAVRPIARSAHFMAHHLASNKLSTGHIPSDLDVGVVDGFVDNSVDNRPEMTILRLGLVVPKRHARRSVTRTLVKVQIRAGIRRHLDSLVAGDWVVRLRAPIDRKQFPSARSETLATLLHAEIDALLGDAARRARRALVQAAPGGAA